MKATKLWLLAALCLLSSCGSDKPYYALESEEFRPYLDSFFHEAAIRGVDLPPVSLTVVFGSLPPPTLADTSYGSEASTITVDAYAWRHVWPITREIIMFHEFGHAILHKGHVPEAIPAIMNPTVLAPDWYLAHRTALLDGFFQ